MNLRDIDCFIKVYECGSINFAADKLYITPQGLSTVISKLERELSCKLFKRDRSGSVPTESGKVFYEYALNMKRDYEHMSAEISRITRHEKGVVRFGYSFGAYIEGNQIS